MTVSSVIGVHRGTMQMDKNFSLEAHTIATRSEPNPDLEFADTPIYNLIIEHSEGTILWDTGVHPDAGDGHWPPGLFEAYPIEDAAKHTLKADLNRTGYDLSDIDYVVQSHLHMDHAGGLHNFADKDIPVFVHEAELQYAYFSAQTKEGSAGYITDDFHHNINWQVISLDRESYFDGIEFIHLPGHTPGMMGLRVELDSGPLFFTSDLIEEQANYSQQRPPGPGLVWNREQWMESFKRVKDEVRRTGAEVIFGHDLDQLDRILEGW
ncbi:N-acyl homoserine lactonase family protein [Natronomonas gomsonensis]|uniref:N-acyl homoserine lactonase family protein n=1 Tax=Natronomonas gomsonensis TaxID=1046043 RepID=UPI0020CA3E95|nr:N-acyl homoserine lactonase family protein [Natronomonas gomsonensis]MCY4729940.1 N-acyl homoserine lactonase family protein [Natronomonas gomsonensis]